jgi:hypothetical protein
MLSGNEAMDLAKGEAARQGWAWVEPARAILRRPWLGTGGRWEIYSNANGRGATARFVIDAETGAVLDKGYIPR